MKASGSEFEALACRDDPGREKPAFESAAGRLEFGTRSAGDRQVGASFRSGELGRRRVRRRQRLRYGRRGAAVEAAGMAERGTVGVALLAAFPGRRQDETADDEKEKERNF